MVEIAKRAKMMLKANVANKVFKVRRVVTDKKAILLIYGQVQMTSMMRCLLLAALRCT